MDRNEQNLRNDLSLFQLKITYINKIDCEFLKNTRSVVFSSFRKTS